MRQRRGIRRPSPARVSAGPPRAPTRRARDPPRARRSGVGRRRGRSAPRRATGVHHFIESDNSRVGFACGPPIAMDANRWPRPALCCHGCRGASRALIGRRQIWTAAVPVDLDGAGRFGGLLGVSPRTASAAARRHPSGRRRVGLGRTPGALFRVSLMERCLGAVWAPCAPRARCGEGVAWAP